MNKPRSKSVLMVIERFFPIIGGVEKQCLTLTNELIKHGVNVGVVTRRIKKDFPKREVFDQKFEIYRLGSPGLSQLADYFSALNLIYFLVRRRKDYQIFHIQGGIANLFGSTTIIMGKILGVRTLAKVATPGEFVFKGEKALEKKKFVHPLLKFRIFWAKKADFYIAQTRAIEKELLDLGIKSNKIFVNPNGVDTQKFAPSTAEEKTLLRKELSIAKESIVFVFIGRIVLRKGLLEFAQIWKKLSLVNKNIVWLIVGSGLNQPDSVESKLVNYLDQNCPKNSVRLLGDQQEIVKYLKAADVFVYPSLHPEGAANSILEAMACGLPVLATNIGGINEMVEHGKNGFLAENQEEMRRLPQSLIDSRALRVKLGKVAREKAMTEFSIEKTGKNYLRYYEEILER